MLEYFKGKNEFDISESLRTEFILFTSKGIQMCTKRAHMSIQRAHVETTVAEGTLFFLSEAQLKQMTAEQYEQRVVLGAEEVRFFAPFVCVFVPFCLYVCFALLCFVFCFVLFVCVSGQGGVLFVGGCPGWGAYVCMCVCVCV